MKRLVKYGILLTACTLVLSSCNCFKKMAKHQDRISVVANPEVLLLVGNQIVTDVTVSFPAEYYNPKAIVRVTPILVFEGGAIEGTPKYFQGEKVHDNYTVISKDNGGVYTMPVSFAWDPRARRSVLELKVEGKCNETDDFQLGGVFKVAEGVNTLQQSLVYAHTDDYEFMGGGEDYGMMISLPDEFRRVTEASEYMNIMYQVNRSNVRPHELSKEATQLFEEFIREYNGKDRVTMGNIQARGYASPEGPEGLNDRLSKARSESGKAAIAKDLKDVEGLNYDVAAYGEDWDGFKALVEASDMKDKNLILQVLNMYSSSAQRDIEIKNMSAVYEELKKNILPELRRTQMVATIDIEGKTDEELVAAAHNDLSILDLEEMLYAAKLVNEGEVKANIYKAAIERYNDARAWNNLGVVHAVDGNWNEAERSFERAMELASHSAFANNLALVALAKGEMDEAARHLPSATSITKGLASVHAGEYATASANLQGYNKAVAEVLNGNLTAAKNALVGDNSANAAGEDEEATAGNTETSEAVETSITPLVNDAAFGAGTGKPFKGKPFFCCEILCPRGCRSIFAVGNRT